MTSSPDTTKTFTYEEAQKLMPEVVDLTRSAVEKIDSLFAGNAVGTGEEIADEVLDEYNEIVDGWAEAILDMGIDVKGLWLVDFDSGSGYYCWKYPEPALSHFHGYDEGFQGRVKLN